MKFDTIPEEIVYDENNNIVSMCIDGTKINRIDISKTVKKLRIKNSNDQLLDTVAVQFIEELDMSNNKFCNAPISLNNLVKLSCSFNRISSLYYGQHFSENLLYVDISNNFINKLPKLSDTIKYLDISSNLFTSFPENLPKNLETFNCSYNKINILPNTIQDSIKVLICRSMEIKFIPDYKNSNIEELDISGNDLVFISKNIPGKLKKLLCSNNDLEGITNKLPNLEFLDISYNEIEYFPEYLPGSLKVIKCSNNKFDHISKFPKNLEEFWCGGNKIEEIVNIPDTLKILHCNRNYIQYIPEVPEGLKELYISFNIIDYIPDYLPKTLEIFNCESNHIVEIPKSIKKLTQLKQFKYFNNEIDSISSDVQQFLMTVGKTIYNDRQSVHDHHIQNSLKESINKLIKNPFIDSIDNFITDDILSFESNELIIEHCKDDNYIDNDEFLTFKNIFAAVIYNIFHNNDSKEIINILDREIQESGGNCFTRKISAIVNCLNGFNFDVIINISDSEQIGNIICVVKKKYSGKECIKVVRERLLELGYTNEIIEEWIVYLKD